MFRGTGRTLALYLELPANLEGVNLGKLQNTDIQRCKGCEVLSSD